MSLTSKPALLHDDDDVYYRKGRRPREDEGEESYEKQRQRPGRGGSYVASSFVRGSVNHVQGFGGYDDDDVYYSKGRYVCVFSCALHPAVNLSHADKELGD